jgi:hypothetical protein
MMLTFALLLAIHAASSFTVPPQQLHLPLRIPSPACELRGASGMVSSVMIESGMVSSVVIDRRSMLVAAGGALLTGARPVVATPGPDPAVVEKIKKGVKELSRGGSLGARPIEELVIGVIDDGSPDSMAALAGVTQAGAKVVAVPYSGDVAKAQAAYKSGGCGYAIVMNTKQLKELMAGEGLYCEDCNESPFSDSSRSQPHWFIVMNSNGKSPKELEAEGSVDDRQCQVAPDGTKLCVYFSISIPTYGAETIDKLVIDPQQGYRPLDDVPYVPPSAKARGRR